MHRTASYFLLVAFTTAACAQTLAHPAIGSQVQPANSAPSLNIVPATSSIDSCPVGLRADPAIGLTQNTINTRPGLPSQTFTVELNNLGARNITRAQFTVHGLTGQAQVNPANLSDTNASTASKQVELTLKVTHDSKASAPLLAEGFTSIRWIELDSLTYADGSAWHASPQHTCSVIPNRLMLVASH